MNIKRIHFETIDSTNTWAKQHASEFGRTDLTVITASEQSAGRGRFKRKWESPSSLNVYATFCFFIENYREDLKNIAQVLAISTCAVIQKMGFNPALKWPNDIMLSNKKIAGILCETTLLADQLCIALGIGLNVNMPLEMLQKIDKPATSLFAEDRIKRDLEEVIICLQNEFAKDLKRFIISGFQDFLQIYKSKLTHSLGDLIHFQDNHSRCLGIFKKVNDDGSLNLELESGEIKTFHAGEILNI
jgi:BirA family transcriptional regulator, biotin operon repressor / biotin---[acetyl-CoA-carboxylase] ligase